MPGLSDVIDVTEAGDVSPAGGAGGVGETAELSGHVIVCGLDGIGVTVVEHLHRYGQDVVVLEQYATPTQVASVASSIRGSVASRGGLDQTLLAAGIHSASAVVCVVSKDIENVRIALQARHMSATVRVVSQLGNRSVRHAMTADNGPGAVIDSAALAAPSIIEACLGRRRHQMLLETTTFVATTVPAVGGTLRSTFGDLAPVAVVRQTAEGPLVVACPGRDFVTEVGDEATMLGTPEELGRRGIDVQGGSTAVARESWPRRATSRFVAGLRSMFGEFDPGLYRALGVLVGLVLISTVLLVVGYNKPGMSVLDGLYFSVETVATVGYGDFSFVAQDWWLRIWAIFLMLSGITTTAVLMAYLADLLISRRLNHSSGRRRARQMTGHVIVVGLGAFGLEVASGLLAAGKQVVVIEQDQSNRFLAEAIALDLPVIFGDATSADILNAARLREAEAIAILTSNDMVNIETGIAVRDLVADRWEAGALPVVMRVFDRFLSQTVAVRFGFENIQSTEENTAPWFVAAALGLEVLGAFTVAQQPFTIGRLTIEAGSALAGMDMMGLSANTRVIALHRAATGGLEHPPRRGTRFEPGDLAYILGPHDELVSVLRHASLAALVTHQEG